MDNEESDMLLKSLKKKLIKIEKINQGQLLSFFNFRECWNILQINQDFKGSPKSIEISHHLLIFKEYLEEKISKDIVHEKVLKYTYEKYNNKTLDIRSLLISDQNLNNNIEILCDKKCKFILDIVKEFANEIKQDNNLIILKFYQIREIYFNLSNLKRCEDCIEYISISQYIKVFKAYLDKKITLDILRQTIFYFKFAEQTDKVLNGLDVRIEDKDFNIKGLYNDNKITVYFDTMIFDKYFKDIEFQQVIQQSKEKFAYAYSPVHICEILRMDKNIQSEREKSLASLTNNLCILPNGSDYKLCYEEVSYSKNRINKDQSINNELEELNLLRRDKKELFFQEYTKDKHVKCIANSKDVFREYKEEIDSILMEQGLIYNLDDLNNNSSRYNTDTAVMSLYQALDYIGYKIDNKDKTIKSSIYDKEHLTYARNVDFFITNDKKFANRSKLIYKFLGITTKVLNDEEFLKEIVD